MKKILTVLGVVTSGFVSAQCDNANLSAWSASQNPSGGINVTAGSAMGGTTCGLDVAITHGVNNADWHYVEDNSPVNEQRYRAAFCINPNGLVIPDSGNNRRPKMHNAQCIGGAGAGCTNVGVVQMKLENFSGGDYRLDSYVRDANLGGVSNNKQRFHLDIPDTGATRIEYDLQMGANGSFRVWVNATSESDTPAFELANIDTTLWSGGISRARLGHMNPATNVNTGQSFYLDEFESRRQTFIGGTCN
jgi:hypothetical protein